MAKPSQIELTEAGISIPILYEDRSVLAVDKPAGWMLAPDSWDHTGRNLQLAIQSSLNGRDYWAASRNLKFLRFVHRLDTETSGALLFAKSPGALRSLSEMFESRRVEKHYLAVVQGLPAQNEWTCNLWIYPDTKHKGIMKTMPPDPRAATARDALTHFRVLQSKGDKTLIEACPETGRTHQIRVHLAAAGLAVIGDDKYGTPSSPPAKPPPLALRAWQLHYRDPFRKQMVHIRAPAAEFIRAHGFDALETRIAPPKIDSPPTPH